MVGELSLEGATRSAKGALSMAMAAARQENLRGIIVPDVNAAEAAVVEDIDVIPVSSLAEAVAFFARAHRHRSRPLATGRTVQFALALSRRLRRRPRSGDGQARAIIAAAGSHNLLDARPARHAAKPCTYHDTLPTILPPLCGWPFISGIPTSGRCWLPIVAGLVGGADHGAGRQQNGSQNGTPWPPRAMEKVLRASEGMRHPGGAVVVSRDGRGLNCLSVDTLAGGLPVMLMVGTIVFLPVALPLMVTGTQVNPGTIVRMLILPILLPFSPRRSR